jgi:hypothetical protein
MKIINLAEFGAGQLEKTRLKHHGGQFTHITIESSDGKIDASRRENVRSLPDNINVELGSDSGSNLTVATEIQASIVLPMPDNLVFPYNADWQQDEGGTMARAFRSVKDMINSGHVPDLSKTLESMGAEASNLAQRFIQSTAGARVGQIGGVTANPNIEMLYSAPSVRRFDLSWSFAFKSRGEAEQFNDFSQIMIERMHPEFVNERNGVWKVPDTFEIEFVNAKTRKIAKCALLSFTENVTASGAGWKSFVDGQPAFVQVTANFQELEPLVRQDIEEGY